MGLKDLFKEKITLKLLAGGHVLPEKDLPVPVQAATLMAGSKRGEVIISVPFAGKKEWTLKEVSWERSHERSVGKAAAGAIVGGVLTGGVGAVVGGAIGARKKDTSEAFITIADESVEHELHIKCDQTLYTKLSNMKA